MKRNTSRKDKSDRNSRMEDINISKKEHSESMDTTTQDTRIRYNLGIPGESFLLMKGIEEQLLKKQSTSSENRNDDTN